LIQGFHELRVMRYTDVAYVPFDEHNPYIRDVMQAYRDIYMERDVCEFMLMYLSTWIDGYDAARVLVLLGGGGSNGKTWSVLFPQRVLGDQYVKVLRMQLLTDEHEGARDANSAFMQLKDLRGGYFDEANEGARLNPARVKSIVTPGSQTGRDLYCLEEQFENTANTIAISNFDFIINSTDNGTWDRLKFYQCKARFVHHPDPASPYERAIRPELTNEWPKDPNYRAAMLSILVHYRLRLQREFCGDVRRIPVPTIDAETRAFRMKQDPISRFIAERIVISPSSAESLVHAVDAYREWYRDTMGVRLAAVANVENMLENSRISQYIVRDDSGAKQLTGVRVRVGHADQLREFESLIE
jgi:phage/plasmid-associated DNA primase